MKHSTSIALEYSTLLILFTKKIYHWQVVNSSAVQVKRIVYLVCCVQIYRKTGINTTSYTLTDEEWAEMSNECPDGFYWSIQTSEIRTPSNAYYSQINFTPVKHQYLSHDYYDIYTERQVYLSAGEQYDYTLSVSSEGYHLIQTCGTLSVVLELYSSDGTLLNSSSGSSDTGYGNNAFLSYNFDKDENYILRIKALVNMMMGNTKIVIVTTDEYDDYDERFGLI